MSLLNDDSRKYPNKGLKALAQEAPEVVKRMGYKDGSNIVDTLNANPRIVLNGIKVAIDSKMLDLEDAQKNNDERRVESIGQEINELDKQKIIIENSFKDVPMAEGGEMDDQMSMLMVTKEPEDDMMPEEDMLPDDEMEDEYLDFILDEALDSEEEDYLMSQLQSNERLSEIFDKVIDIAQEFAGSGPVEGPGSGVSDSIPARLSDGEFVFTAKAVEEIGADNLMAMMKDAETKADDRQGLANGGEPEEEDTVEMPVEKPATKQDIRVVKTTIDNGGKGLLDEDEISKSIKSKMMLDNRTGRHVQS